MGEFFQHLKPAPSPSDDSAKSMLAHLLDLDRNLGAQSAPRVITDPVTGRRVLALHTMPLGVADSSPYDADYPSSLIGVTALSDAEVTTHTEAVLSRLETSFDQPAQFVNNLPDTRQRYTRELVSGWPVGVDDVAFSVSHLGGSAWQIVGGLVRGGGIDSNTQRLATSRVSLSAGFIGCWVSLSPRLDDEEAQYIYTINCGGFTGETSYTHRGPYLTLTGDTSQEGQYAEFEPGEMFLPFAYVQAPQSGRALVQSFFRAADVVFPDRYTVPGVPIPSGGTLTP